MDQLKIFFTTRTALVLIIMGILLAGLVGGVYLSQRQTQLKSQAAVCAVGQVCGSDCGAGGVGQCDQCSGGWCEGGKCATCGAVNNLPACKKTSICNQDVTGNLPSDCTKTCRGASAYYHCVQGDNKDCVADIQCSPEDSRCVAAGSTGGSGSSGGSGGSQTETSDAAECGRITFKQNNQEVKAPASLVAGQTYNVEIKMDNRNAGNSTYTPNTWTTGEYFLGFPTNGPPRDFGAGDFKVNADSVAKDNVWQVNWPDHEKLRLPLTSNVPAGGSHTFKLTVTPQKSGTHTFYWGMVHEGVNWFGGQCTSDISVIASQAAAPGTGGSSDDVAGSCEFKLLETKTLSEATDIISGLQYKLQITMKNAGKSTWGTDKYILKPSTKTISDWGVSPIVLKESLTGNSVAPGEGATFEFPVTGPALKVADQPESRSFSFQMANGVSEFGAACQTGAITILPKTKAPNATACFILSANQDEVTSAVNCNDTTAKALGIIHPYPSDPTELSYKLVDTSAGVKTIYVRFISTRGEIADGFGQISFAPDPVVSAIACSQSATGTGTIVALAGTNFGSHVQQGQGSVTVNGTQAQIVTWDPVKGLIQATVPTRLEGALDIDLKVDDGRSVAGGKCTIGVASVQFTANNQCSVPDNFDVDNVDTKILENVTGAKPFLTNKISIKKGIPQDFTPNLEANKKYILAVKAPRALSKKIEFTTGQGTLNLGQIKMIIGDISPFSSPDGKINSLDTAEMIRQWALLPSSSGTTLKTADLNLDGVVNSLDYSCLKLGFNQEDEVSINTLGN